MLLLVENKRELMLLVYPHLEPSSLLYHHVIIQDSESVILVHRFGLLYFSFLTNLFAFPVL